VKIILII